jgi:hypothetical protein
MWEQQRLFTTAGGRQPPDYPEGRGGEEPEEKAPVPPLEASVLEAGGDSLQWASCVVGN